MDELQQKYAGVVFEWYVNDYFDKGMIRFTREPLTFAAAVALQSDLSRLGWVVTHTDWSGAGFSVHSVRVARPHLP